MIATGRRQRVSGTTMRRLFWLWVTLVALFFLWEAAGYRGLYNRLVEWQMGRFGTYLPMLSVTLLALLLAAPALLLLLRHRRRDEAERAAATRTSTDTWSPARAERFNRRLYLVFAGTAAAFALAAVLALLWTLTIPATRGVPRPVSLTLADSAAPEPGYVAVDAIGRLGRVVQFRQRWPWGERSVYFAPVFASGQRDRGARLFVQVLPATRAALPERRMPNGVLVQARLPGRVLLVRRDERRVFGWTPVRTGVLVRGGMPGTIRTLYRALGYGIDPDYRTLYASSFDARWRWYVSAMQLGACALLVLVFALVQRRHWRRLRQARYALPGT